MKILFIASEFSTFSGWGRYTVEYTRELVLLGHSVTVWLPKQYLRNAVPNLKEKVELKFLLPTARFGLKGLWGAMRSWKILKAAVDFDLVHLQQENLFFYVPFLPRKQKKVFLSINGTYALAGAQMPWRILYRLIYQRCSSIILISEYTRKIFLQNFLEFNQKSVVNHLGVKFLEGVQPLELSAREKSFLMVGHLKLRKGHSLMIQALKFFPDHQLLITGHPDSRSYLEKLREEAKTQGVLERVQFLGEVSDQELQRLYAKVQLLVMPSLNVDENFEGFGLVHLEAYVFGTPSIGSWDCGNEDAIQHGKTGYLVRQGDLQDLISKIKMCLDSEQIYRQLSVQSVQWAKLHDWRVSTQRLNTVYGSMQL